MFIGTSSKKLREKSIFGLTLYELYINLASMDPDKIREMRVIAAHFGPLIDSFSEESGESYDGHLSYNEVSHIVGFFEKITPGSSTNKEVFQFNMTKWRRLKSLMEEMPGEPKDKKIAYWEGIDCNDDDKVDIPLENAPPKLIKAALKAEQYADEKDEHTPHNITTLEELTLHIKDTLYCLDYAASDPESKKRTEGAQKAREMGCLPYAGILTDNLLEIAAGLIIFYQDNNLLMEIAKSANFPVKDPPQDKTGYNEYVEDTMSAIITRINQIQNYSVMAKIGELILQRLNRCAP